MACPLCGLGDAGSEHLVVACPAVGLAWASLAGSHRPLSLVQALRHPGPHLRVVAALLSAAAVLYGSLLGRSVSWR